MFMIDSKANFMTKHSHESFQSCALHDDGSVAFALMPLDTRHTSTST